MGYSGKQVSRSGDIRRFNFTGNGSNTAFDLGFTPATQNQLIVTVNGLVQHYDAFSVTGSTLTFTGTPASGDAIQVTAVVDAVGVAAIPDGAIANVATLTVSGNSTFTGNITGTATFANNIAVTGNATFSNTTTHTGAATFSNTVTITGTSTVSNNAFVGTSSQSPNVNAQITVGTGATTKPAMQFNGGDTNWWGRISQSTSGGTIGSFLSSGGAWSVSGTTFTATKDYDGSFSSGALFIGSQYNSDSANTQFKVLKQNGGANTTDGSVSTLMNIDGGGRVTLPFNPSFCYWQSDASGSSQNPTVNNGVVVFRGSSNGGQHNRGSYYNTTNGKFTAPVTGTYHFDYHWIMNSATVGSECNYAMRINGGAFTVDGRCRGYIENSGHVSVNLYLNAGDYVEILKSDTTGISMYPTDRYSWFSGFLVG